MFAEWAFHRGGYAGLLGAQVSLSKAIQIGAIARTYSRSFSNPYGSAFGERSKNEGENGLYAGLSWSPSKRWRLNAYIDQYAFPWLRYQADAPSWGQEAMCSIIYQPERKISMLAQLRVEEKPSNVPGMPMDRLAFAQRKTFKIAVMAQIERVFQVKCAVHTSRYMQDGQYYKGFAVSEELRVQRGGWRLTLGAVLFHTDNYDARVYGYESDVLYAFSMPAYQGKGNRKYVMLQGKIAERIGFWVRLSQNASSQYAFDRNMGVVPPAPQWDAKMQIQYKLN
jgi:hypothetical protein